MDGYRAYTKHVNPGLGALLELTGRDLRLVRGRGGVLEDAAGRRYDDWISGFGSLNLGHNPEPIKAAIRSHLESDAPNLYVENLNPHAGLLAERLVAAAGPGFETVFFSNSGSEAVEAALKTAIAATGRRRIVHAEGSYHGTTLGALSCMARGPYRKDFEAVLAPAAEVPFGDLGALERELSAGDVAAFILEPIQVEAGVRVATTEYLQGAKALCAKAGALLIFDEVQTGMGRTGTLFAWQGYGVAPDLFTLAKSLGGGLVPIGATVTGRGLWTNAFRGFRRSEIHNSTFGGNALACRAALATLEIVAAPKFLAGVQDRAAKLFSALEKALSGCGAVERVAWRGLLGGIRLREGTHPWLRSENLGLKDLEGEPVSGVLFVERLARRQILVQLCGHDWSVVRVEPPLTVDPEVCGRFVEAVADAARWLEKNA
jgi:acetylornithine/succinyldiaminopimelate/putrescine aminotransferase